MKILVIAPHPDDEVLGCGGTIKKHINQGDEVSLCIVTKSYTPDWSQEFIENRKKEINCSNEVLGIKQTYFLDLPTVKLDTVPQKKLNDLISECVERVGPELLYIPFGGDINKDHRLVFEASLVVSRPKPKHSIKKILSYEVLSETEWGSSQARKIGEIFIPHIYIDISDVLEDKVKAMSCYKSELKEYPHPRSLEAITTLAKKRGSEAGLKAAEAFVLIREVS
ncbi:PIG-L deacetylase family protein [Patescibacteria group bacterium]